MDCIKLKCYTLFETNKQSVPFLVPALVMNEVLVVGANANDLGLVEPTLI
jgi:hypothetical protein